MRRGLFIFMAWICVVGIQAQSDFSFILNKEGKIIVLPKNKTYELNIPKHRGIYVKERLIGGGRYLHIHRTLL